LARTTERLDATLEPRVPLHVRPCEGCGAAEMLESTEASGRISAKAEELNIPLTDLAVEFKPIRH
jgi:hypothetical protein